MPQDEATRADVAFHDATAHLYEPTLEPLFRAYADLIVDPWVESLSGEGEAIDIGCGTGAMTVKLAERGYRVCGVDHSAGMRAVATSKIEALGLSDQVELVEGDVRALPYDNEQFDLATCQGVLHHLADMQLCLREVERVLKPNGVFYLAEPCIGSTPITRLLERLAPERPDPPAWVPDHDEGPIDTRELVAILDELGLDHKLTFWSQFRGVHLLPLRVQRALIASLSRPWRKRAGNMVIVTGRKPHPRG